MVLGVVGSSPTSHPKAFRKGGFFGAMWGFAPTISLHPGGDGEQIHPGPLSISGIKVPPFLLVIYLPSAWWLGRFAPKNDAMSLLSHGIDLVRLPSSFLPPC